MADLELAARLRYLNESAHLLATTAPSTSKYLMSRCNSLMFDHEIEQPDAQKRKSCGACGNIKLLGWDGNLEVKSQGSKKKQERKKEKGVSSGEKAIVYTCGSCNKKTRHCVDIAPVTSRPKKGSIHHGAISKNASMPVQSLTTANRMAMPSTNASSKKRAKTRKLGGLGALLAKQKASDAIPSRFGLDLMDLMKKV
ncbi:hypothetical protein DSL72_007289 [Monilinia vaccinii-corymbosi]|uniref:Uncharacterized protein n=1 Tax=Monilinia vaccinii-corymbosi TaxID=61207 RepID=A0A8A3PMK9_9HELO|nr:hypothetical protein DSL72_007289 [Monilinia vaccinii-corymbosi]